MTVYVVADHQYTRVEYDWLLIDAFDRVGYFSTAGSAPIPQELVDNAERFEMLADVVRELPFIGEAIVQIVATWDISDWVDVASRGFYAFDWRADRNCYALIARPTRALDAASLPHSMAAATPRVSFDLAHITALFEQYGVLKMVLRAGSDTSTSG